MDNQEQLKQNFELPTPQSDSLPATVGGLEAPTATTEQMSTSGSAAAPGGAISAQDAASAQAIVGAPPSASTTNHTAHLAASDIDLIEKEWVEKAKAIVASTHGDPYTQNKEINKIRVDYIKKRYNKDIKLVND